MGASADPLFLSLSWFKSMNPYYHSILSDRHQISVFSGFKVPKIPAEVQTNFDFNIAERKMLYSAVSLVYHYQCLDFLADLRIFYFREKPEAQFKISLGLGNIGKTTDFFGGRDLKDIRGY
jgi:hypothetical protein